MTSDKLKIVRDRITNAETKDEKRRRQIAAINKARKREINKLIFRAEK